MLTIQLNERVSGEEDLVQKQQFVGSLSSFLALLVLVLFNLFSATLYLFTFIVDFQKKRVH